MRRWQLRMRFVGQLLPAITRYITPGYHPSQEREPAGYRAWLKENPGAPAERASPAPAQEAPSPCHGL
jgi:hypothetical protein